eukprot:CAMPEP_0116575436 /NCGR_PEP_ID=MMETSP0397-20121206/19956_1 /TAXON_ID=216820 /ORGANISM="Cyclophora tenuis, Strain ECT3854" /LENGTH=52 /DNA_ID=CAMNT_0004104327 /DNA_START=329 /DNA_END=487 /DNA_ORIENTATION=-
MAFLGTDSAPNGPKAYQSGKAGDFLDPHHIRGAGILTSCPSTTPFGLALGPD